MIHVYGQKNVADLKGNRSNRNVIEFAIDDSSDVANLPGTDRVMEGSTAIVLQTSQVYMLGSNGWVLL